MCMLTYLPGGILPNVDRLTNGTISNRDGHGWAIVVTDDDGNGSHIITGHGMNPDAVIEAFRLAREQHPTGPALFHSRMTTGGLTNESNCHPFVVDKDPRTVLAHNGILPDMKMGAKDVRADTRYFCDEWGWLMSPGASPGDDFNLNSKRGRRRLSRWLGRPNKFLILTVDPKFRRNAFLINGDQGIWEDDGCWYSNTGYVDRAYSCGVSSYRYGAGWGEWDDYYAATKVNGKKWWEDAEGKYDRQVTGSEVWTRLANGYDNDAPVLIDKDPNRFIEPDAVCQVCGGKGHIAQLNYCTLCGVCQDCLGDALDEYYSDMPCTCAWPMGTHPGHKRAVESAFSEKVDADPLAATDVVVSLSEPQLLSRLALAANKTTETIDKVINELSGDGNK